MARQWTTGATSDSRSVLRPSGLLQLPLGLLPIVPSDSFTEQQCVLREQLLLFLSWASDSFIGLPEMCWRGRDAPQILDASSRA